MDERSGTIRLVEPAHDSEVRGLVATVSRTDVEQAMRSDEGPVDLLLDVERVAPEGDGREKRRIALGWEPQDLERLLETTHGDEISLTFDEGELERLLDEDVEAHGMRETLAVLTVAAGMAAAGAGSAFASPVTDGALPGGTATPAAQVTASEVSTGLTAATAARTAAASEISTGITAATPAAPSEVSTGITAKPTAAPVSTDQPSWSPSATDGLAAAGAILALTAVGFAMRSHRGPRVAT
ncbi:MAG: hypothetical protein E6G19_08445 [Actinobacteria bacterium]|nr:MAG: hypothetical protein E6G19_08445 [Actinomycetota bacterium]